ncbi:MAG TPA: hypothetical protein VF810_01370 [Patescibacteria group bacterium]
MSKERGKEVGTPTEAADRHNRSRWKKIFNRMIVGGIIGGLGIIALPAILASLGVTAVMLPFSLGTMAGIIDWGVGVSAAVAGGGVIGRAVQGIGRR